MSKVVVAAVQAVPEYHNLGGALAKARKIILEASAQGAKIVVFPETWLQGYPYWASISVRDERFHEFRRALNGCSVDVSSTAMQEICAVAAEANAIVVMGFHEKSGYTLYNSVAYIGADGKLLRVHRKLIPTTTERLVWGRGDGSDLDPVDTDIGKLGGLICFEHQMSPARFALCNSGVELHASLWPGHALINDIIDASTRHLAYENGCFVIVAREIMSAQCVPSNLPDISDEPSRWEAKGGSAIIGPNGKYIVGPVFDQEEVVMAEIDLSDIADTKWWFDGAGHYTRPDVFQLLWNKSAKPSVKKEGMDDY